MPDAIVLNPGDRVIYRHLHRGGYGYETCHPAVVVRAAGKRVTIRVARRAATGAWAPVETSVTRARLTARATDSNVEHVLRQEGNTP